jgi:hypothetical protein
VTPGVSSRNEKRQVILITKSVVLISGLYWPIRVPLWRDVQYRSDADINAALGRTSDRVFLRREQVQDRSTGVNNNQLYQTDLNAKCCRLAPIPGASGEVSSSLGSRISSRDIYAAVRRMSGSNTFCKEDNGPHKALFTGLLGVFGLHASPAQAVFMATVKEAISRCCLICRYAVTYTPGLR